MARKLFATLTTEGIVFEAAEETARLCGIPLSDFVGQPLTKHMSTEDRVRFTCEIEALAEGAETWGRVHLTLIGFDGVGRRLTLEMSRLEEGLLDVAFSRYTHPQPSRRAPGPLLLDAGRLLPVARRVSALVRRSETREKLLAGGLEVLAEVTSARAGAVLEWGEASAEQTITTIGPFDHEQLRGIFRPAILARLTRGDVVVKETSTEGASSDSCLVILPLLGSAAPLGIAVLLLEGYAVLVPEEQQSLVVLGEILGLGLKALSGAVRSGEEHRPHQGDEEASDAMGRLSAGLSHEIINAVTVLRSNVEELMLRGGGHGRAAFPDASVKDSLIALDTIHDLTLALGSFAPEARDRSEDVDLLRVIDTVNRSLRFYDKRGVNIVLDRPVTDLPRVQARGHDLVRSLFLVFVELLEVSAEAGVGAALRLGLATEEQMVTLTITVAAGPFSLPPVLLAQLEKGGALTRHVNEAGGEVGFVVDHEGNLSISLVFPAVASPRRSFVGPAGASTATRRGTILVADDEVAVIRSLRRVLERDHDVLAAHSGEEALAVLRANPEVEIILYDVSMPRLTGPEFYAELARLRQPLAGRIIFVSGGAPDAEIAEFLRATALPIIDKPFNLPELSELIAALLA